MHATDRPVTFNDVPKTVKDRLNDWHSSLSEQEKVILNRYVRNSDVSSPTAFLSSVAAAAVREENWKFASSAATECLRTDITEIQRFDATESLVEAHIGMKKYDEAKEECEANLALYQKVAGALKERNNGNVPEKMACRNRYIDILVGIESAYDEALELLDRFFENGMISAEDLKFRRQSLKIHRLQRSFDGVYTYTYKN